MSKVPIFDMAVLLAASKNRTYRESVYESFRAMINFIQTQGLTTRQLLSDSTSNPPNDFKLYESDLTAEGIIFVDSVVPRWFAWIEKGSSAQDISVLERGLKRQRNRKMANQAL